VKYYFYWKICFEKFTEWIYKHF